MTVKRRCVVEVRPLARNTLLAACVTMLGSGAAPAAPRDAPDAPAPALRKALAERYPQVQIVGIRPAPIPGLYEIYSADRLFYADATGNYLLAGTLVDTRTKIDLSRQHFDAFNSVDFARLPVDQSIRTVRGSGARHIAVFEDPDCPYCRQLEKEMLSLQDVTIYTYLYPLADVHPAARANAHAIWCATDRAQAWHEWMIEGKIPTAAAVCAGDPIDALQTLGNALHVTSTPTLFFEGGRRITGTVTAGEIEQVLKAQSSAAAGASSAAAAPRS